MKGLELSGRSVLHRSSGQDGKEGRRICDQRPKIGLISNGLTATHALLMLCLDRSLGMRGTAIALLPLDLPGISRGKLLVKLGLRSYAQGALIFDEVRIPEERMLIADPEKGFETQRWILTPACELLGTMNTGPA